jgi:hypothetical protein
MDGDRLRHELDSLLHPGSAFGHPSEVANDPDLTVNEKRAILSAWASDACASEDAPHMRPTATGALVPWDDIIDALRSLDKQSRSLPKLCRRKPRWRRGSGSTGETGQRAY